MKIRMRISFNFSILASIMFSTSALGGLIVNPTNPTSSDVITIDYSTFLPCPAYVVTNTFHTINGNNISLDLQSYYQGIGCSDYVVPYEHTFTIGELPAGVYQVQSSLELVKGEYVTYWSDSTSFEVIPEPNSVALLLLGTGILYLRRKRFSNRVEHTRYNARRLG